MRSAGNFHPEWGYLAPAPSFLRTARIVIVAMSVGAVAGAGVVFSLVDRPAAEVGQSSVAARTLARPAAAASTPAGPPAPAQMNAQAVPNQNQAPRPAAAGDQDGGPAASAASASSPMQPPAGISALAEVPAASDASSVQIRDQAAPGQKKAAKKHRFTSRYASPGQPANGAGREPFLFERLFNFGGNAPEGEYFANEALRGYSRDGRRDGYYDR